MTRLQQLTYLAIARMNDGMRSPNPTHYFDMRVMPGYENFTIYFGENVIMTNDDFSHFTRQQIEENDDDLKVSGYIQYEVIAMWKEMILIPVKNVKTEGYNATPETRELIDAVDTFSEAMKIRLIEKGQQGYTGWANKTNNEIATEIGSRLVKLGEGKTGIAVGIANWCLINWLINPQIEPGSEEADGIVENLVRDYVGEETKVEGEVKQVTQLPPTPTHYFKDKPYLHLADSEVKILPLLDVVQLILGREEKPLLTEEERELLKDTWIPVSAYKALYANNRIWVRHKDEFEQRFTKAADYVPEQKEDEEVATATVDTTAEVVKAEVKPIVNQPTLVDDTEQNNSSL